MTSSSRDGDRLAADAVVDRFNDAFARQDADAVMAAVVEGPELALAEPREEADPTELVDDC